MNNITESFVSVAALIVGVAIVAVIVSRNSQAPAVLQSLGSAFSNALGVAVSPVTGAAATPNLSYPGGTMGGLGSFSGGGISLGFSAPIFG